MNTRRSGSSLTTTRLIVIPVLISLAVTLLRLTGEVNRWSEQWFSRDTGGLQPSGWSWLIGISWLPVPFGIYFGWRLAREAPSNRLRPVIFSVLGVGIAILGLYVVVPRIPLPFPQILLCVWAALAIPALLQWFGWPALFKTLVVYGLASRAIVAIVMFFAMRGEWGTHYDYYGMPAQFQMSFWPRYLWLAFFPQLVFWVSQTVILGALAGSITAALTRSRM
jgi:hypothetical protein